MAVSIFIGFKMAVIGLFYVILQIVKYLFLRVICNNNFLDAMMSVTNKNDYHRIIREMIWHENEVRNSRNNWFMAIQGLLINAFIKTLVHQKDLISTSQVTCYILIGIVSIGLLTSISFLFAAWRSEKAIAMAMSAWNLFLEENATVVKDYPPVCLMTDGIIDEKNPPVDKIGIKDWIECMNKQMYPKGKECKICRDKLVNKLELLMPFKFIPVTFIVVWIIITYFLV